VDGGPTSRVVRHAERSDCPRRPRDRVVLDEIQEPTMNPQVPAELGVERGPDEVALSREDDPVLVPRERCAIAPRPQDRRGADEDAVERRVEPCHLKVSLERLAMAPEC